MDARLLGIYLNDHLAGASGGIALARRAAKENHGNPVGQALERLIPELEEDRQTILQVLGALGQAPDALKVLGGKALERLGRLKLNGRLLRYSPLSRLWEVEALRAGSDGRMALWQVLERLQRGEPRLARFDFTRLAARAEQHKQVLERLRLAAGDVAFAGKHVLEMPREAEAPAGA